MCAARLRIRMVSLADSGLATWRFERELFSTRDKWRVRCTRWIVAAVICFLICDPVNFIQRCLDFDSDDLALVGSRTIALSSGSGGIS